MRRFIMILVLLVLVLSAMSIQAQGSEVVHVVQPGETLYRISLNYGVTMQAIAERNGITNYNLIYVGQYLVIPGTDDGGGDDGGGDDGGGDNGGETVTYVVRPGDTLRVIANRFNTTVASIVSLNNIPNINLIYVGQVLIISGTSDGGGDDGGGDDGGGDDGGGDDGGSGETVTYVVRAGDTLFLIARRFGTTTTAIAQLNGITNPNLIYVGQVLRISGTAGGGDDGGGGNPPPTTSGFELGGQVLQGHYPYSNLMQQTGMVWAKRQIRWNRGTPASTFQGEIQAAHDRGFKILLSVVGDKNQLASMSATQYYQEFAAFLGGLAGLGADGIEVWNEPNLAREWPAGAISGGSYTQMLSAAYQTIKANNQNTIVISAAPSPTGGFGSCGGDGCNDDVFLSQMASAGAANFMDCLGIHYNAGAVSPYASSGAPVGSASHYSWYYPTMVSLYTRVFPTKQLCFTELGYVSGDGFSQPLPSNFGWASGTSVSEQAQWLADAVRIARGSGRVRMFIIWNVDSTTYLADDPQAGYAIIRPDGTCPACNTVAIALN